MTDRSAIEWTDASWNPIRARLKEKIGAKAKGSLGWHCEHVSDGCKFCYAESMNKRLGTGLPFKPGHRGDIEIFLDEEMLLAPLRWKKPRKIFVGSMTDLFADFVTDEQLDKIFAVAALASHHTLQFLTKRADRMRDYMLLAARKQLIAEQAMHISDLLARAAGSHHARIKLDHFSTCFAGSGPFRNVWLGVSCERQEEADARIPPLLQTPAAVLFISAEPLLGPIDLDHIVAPEKVEGEDWRFSALQTGDLYDRRIENEFDARVYWDSGDGPYRDHALDWVIVGGESGPKASPMHPDWARSLRDQCQSAGVAFFFKQWGEWEPVGPSGSDTACEMLAEVKGNSIAGILSDGQMLERGCEGDADWIVQRVDFARRLDRLLDGREHNDMPGSITLRGAPV